MLLALIEEDIRSASDRNRALSPAVKFLLTLRFFATGSMLIVVGDFVGVSKAAACTCVKKVSRAIAELRSTYIKMPTSPEDLRKTMEEFYEIARFPHVVGAIDCTHVKLQSPGGNQAENFRNRKGYFSWNVQVVCDSRLRIRDIVVRWPGSSHDSHIFNCSAIKGKLEAQVFGDGLLLGDGGYANTNVLLTPLAAIGSAAENLYNESHIRTRNTVERCFGVWKRRFPILSNGIRVALSTSQAIVVATAILHNIAINEHDGEPEEEPELESETNDNDNQDNLMDNNRNNMRRGVLIRNHFQNLL